jgi:hypothetical protein
LPLFFLKDSAIIEPTAYPVVPGSQIEEPRPGASAALRWFAGTSISAFEGVTGTVTLSLTGPVLSGTVEVKYQALDRPDTLRLIGSFSQVPVTMADSGCRLIQRRNRIRAKHAFSPRLVHPSLLTRALPSRPRFRPRHPCHIAVHTSGVRITDAYRWLEDATLLTWPPGSRRRTPRLSPTNGLPQREAFRKRLTELFNYERWSPPGRRGNRFFHLRNDGLQNQDVLWVTEAARPGPARPQSLSADGTVALTSVSVSPDGSLVAYALAAAGSDWNEFKVRDVSDGKDLGDHIRWSKFSGASWTRDGKGFFYGRYPEPVKGEELTAQVRNMKLYYHRIGTDQSADVLVYERPDQPDWGFAPEVTDDGRWLVISV